MPDPTLKDVAHALGSGRIAEARALCDRVLPRTPDDGDALMWSGLIAMAQLRWPEAISAFERALEIRLDPWSLANLGACYAKVGHLDGAERCLRGATELKPDLHAAHIGLAAALHGLRRFEEALARLEVAAALDASDHQVDSRRGCTLVELGRYDEAKDAFERAIARSAAFTYPRLVKFDVPPRHARVNALPPRQGYGIFDAGSVITLGPPYSHGFRMNEP
jgi:tetratricopeptide (TPR) repeat protein